jgi:hypothetical protein
MFRKYCLFKQFKNLNKMNRIIFILLLSTFFLLSSSAFSSEKTSIIYIKNIHANAQNNLIYVKCNMKNNPIKISNLSLAPFLYYKDDEGRKKVHLDSVFAFTNCNGQYYRVYNQQIYLLCKSGDIFIYSQKRWNDESIATSKGRKTTNKRCTEYYFSTDSISQIQKMNYDNLSTYFKSEQEMIEWLTENIKCKRKNILRSYKTNYQNN